MDRTFLCGFCAAAGFEKCKTSPPPINADISLLCSDSDEYGRIDILIFEVEITDENLYEQVVQVANDIGVTISKQEISACAISCPPETQIHVNDCEVCQTWNQIPRYDT